MYRMIRGLIIATPFLAVTACMADEGASSTIGDQEASRGEPGAVVQAADTQTVAWTKATVDRAAEVSPDACSRLVSFNDSSCPSGSYACGRTQTVSGSASPSPTAPGAGSTA